MKEINITPKELEAIYNEILKEISSQEIVQKIIYIYGETGIGKTAITRKNFDSYNPSIFFNSIVDFDPAVILHQDKTTVIVFDHMINELFISSSIEIIVEEAVHQNAGYVIIAIGNQLPKHAKTILEARVLHLEFSWLDRAEYGETKNEMFGGEEETGN